MKPVHRRALLSDERGIIAGWFVRIAITLAVIGVIAFDAGAMAVNYFTLDSTADDIAIATSGFGGTRVTQDQVATEAEELADEAGARLIRAEITPEGQVVIELRREAYTLVAGHFRFLRDYVVVEAEGRASAQ